MQTKLIVGLGNPGKKYEKTRHNVGFMVVDELVRLRQLKWQGTKFSGEWTFESRAGNHRDYFLKPQTYMNLSGDSVAALATFYKILPADILVIYDDLDLPLGRIRVAARGSSGGHNGIKSIIQTLGTEEFARVKIGIGRPSDARVATVDYVLMPFAASERGEVNQTIQRVVQAAQVYLQKGIQDAMNEFNGKAAKEMHPQT